MTENEENEGVDMLTNIPEQIPENLPDLDDWIFGCIEDQADPRDHLLEVDNVGIIASEVPVVLPPKYDVRPLLKGKDPEIYNQRRLGSCTAHAVGYAYAFATIIQNNKYKIPQTSHLYVYYNTRILQGKVDEDTGASVRNTLKAGSNTGMCREKLWPYFIIKYKDQPPQNCYEEGLKCQITEYVSIPRNLNTIKSVLYSGTPIIFGFQIYSSFIITYATGLMPTPNPDKDKVKGGHAVVAVGYDDNIKFPNGSKGGLLVRNSWGVIFGKQGMFYLPYCIVETPMCHSFWIIKNVSNPASLSKDPSPCCHVL